MIIFVYNKFELKNKGTWMAPFIRGFLSVDNKYRGLEKVRYNHTANLIEDQGVLWVIEAGWNKESKKAEVIKTLFYEWTKGRKENSYIIAEYPFPYDKEKYKRRLISSIGKPYDFPSVIIFNPIKLAFKLFFNKYFWFGPKNIEKFYCSKLSSWVVGLKFFYSIDPEELAEIVFKNKKPIFE